MDLIYFRDELFVVSVSASWIEGGKATRLKNTVPFGFFGVSVSASWIEGGKAAFFRLRF